MLRHDTKPIKLKINGEVYDSINEASRKLGVSQSVLSRAWKKVLSSGLSEHTINIMVKTPFTFCKVKDK